MNEEVNNPNPTGIIVSYKMKSVLLSTARWTMILCVTVCISLIYSTISTIASIIGSIAAAQHLGGYTERMMLFRNTISIVSLITSVIVIYTVIMGFQFYNKTKAALLADNEEQLNIAFGKLRSYFIWSAVRVIIGFIISFISWFGTMFVLSHPM